MGIASALISSYSMKQGTKEAESVTAATIADIQKQSAATQNTIEGMADSIKFSQFQKEWQLEEIDSIMGDRLTASGMESLKREATLKAAAAETGSQGGASQAEVIQDTFVQENFNNAMIVRDARVAKDTTKMSMVADILNFNKQTDAMIFGLQSPESVGLQAKANFTNTATSTGKMYNSLLGGLASPIDGFLNGAVSGFGGLGYNAADDGWLY